MELNAIQERLTEAKGRLSSVEDTTVQLANASEQNNKRLEMLWNHVEGLENRSRHNNVRLIGLKEGAEAGGLIKCVQSIMSEGFGIELDGEFEIERAHRSLAPRPGEDQPPRLVLIQFLRSSARKSYKWPEKGEEWSGKDAKFSSSQICPEKWLKNSGHLLRPGRYCRKST